MPDSINSTPLFDYPILTEESEISEELVLQKRMSGCGTKALLTIRMGEAVVVFSILASPWKTLADCSGEVVSELEACEFDLTRINWHLESIDSTRDEIFTTVTEERQSLAEARAAIKIEPGALALAKAKDAIRSSRAAIMRQRKSMASAEKQLRRCEEKIVLSRMQVKLADGAMDQGSRGAAIEASNRAYQAALRKRSLIMEEERVIRETEIFISEAAAALPE